MDMGTKEIDDEKVFVDPGRAAHRVRGASLGRLSLRRPAGAAGEGFASLVTGGGQISYTILTSNVGTPTGAFINQGGTQVLDLQADFDFGTAAGSVAAAADLITQLESNTSAYTLVVATAGGNVTGTLQNAGDSGGGGPGPTPQPGVLQLHGRHHQHGRRTDRDGPGEPHRRLERRGRRQLRDRGRYRDGGRRLHRGQRHFVVGRRR